MGLGTRESPADVARVLSGMVHGIMARVFEHEKLDELAAHSTVPVINALSDQSHPCQVLADVMTLMDEFGPRSIGQDAYVCWGWEQRGTQPGVELRTAGGAVSSCGAPRV